MRREPAVGRQSARAVLLLLVASSLISPRTPSAEAQESQPAPVMEEVFAGEELDLYLRTLQNVGRAAFYPWAIRAFSPREVEELAVADSLHPWESRYAFRMEGSERFRYGLIHPRATAIYNSTFPYGGNDGPLWAGKGLTGAVQIGGYLRYGPVSFVLAPVAFRSQNLDFEPAPIGRGEGQVYASPLSPGNIDLPQRFGPDPYARLDMGSSTLRVDAVGVTVGVSTAAQHWGPLWTHPLILGPNAGGFPHAFAGTQRPIPILIGDLHLRYVIGRLDESDQSPAQAEDSRRFMGGLTAVYLPRGLPGLELGFSRFIHREWPADGLGSSHLRQPFEIGFKQSIPDADERFANNQLASVFGRWNVPGAGFEIFGEFVRIDHAFTTRVFVVEPDDLSGYALGLRRVWEGPDDALTVLRGEVFSTVSSHRQRGGARLSLAYRARHMYRHSGIVQGHTHRGQLLASPAGHGGAGSTLGIDRYHRNGRWSVEWHRRVERDRTVGIVGSDPADIDVTYVLSVDAVRFEGPVDLDVGLAAAYNLNRYLQDDAFNWNLRVGARMIPR